MTVLLERITQGNHKNQSAKTTVEEPSSIKRQSLRFQGDDEHGWKQFTQLVPMSHRRRVWVQVRMRTQVQHLICCIHVT